MYGSKIFPAYETEYIARTTNYGTSWSQSVLNDTGMFIAGAKLLIQSNWYLAGGDYSGPFRPVILHTTNGGAIGIQPVSTEIPVQFSLSQNYPNPFNPVTNIKFQIPKSSFVKLAVYDLLGREVTTLVNGQLKPGTYKADWDAFNFPSGVYFYKLVVGENTNNGGGFVETKKM